MNRYIFLLSLSMLFSFIVTAQTENKCATDEVNRERFESYPELLKVHQQLEEFTQEYIRAKQQNNQSRSGQVYVIPIVFHIVHNYGPENISDEQVYDAVRILNEDFRKLNPDISQVVPAFRNIAADSEIEFRLPTKDRFGNCTNGINRYKSMMTYKGSDNAKFNPWPRDMYLNVWVVQSFENRQGVLGYAYYPSGAEGMGAFVDGIIILYNAIGTIGAGNPNWARSLTHEIGHYLNLAHTWGEGEVGQACGDDNVHDTPITRGTFGCNLNTSFCSPPIIENVQNYMDYSSCPRMFTEGQKERMHAALNSNVSGRNVLWQEATLIKTGAMFSNNTNTCPPVADFTVNNKLVCVGQSITFRDQSWRGPITAWEWEFEGGTPAFSTDKNPIVTFYEPGWKTVKLTVTNSNGQNTKTESKYILVAETNPEFLYENFEDLQKFENGWAVENYDNNASKFSITGTAAYSGNKSLMLNNYDVDLHDMDAIITPAYDFLNSFNTQLTFKYSAATRELRSENITDQLKIYYSTNCGQTWTQFFVLSGINLINAGNHRLYFVPTKESDWTEVTITLPNPVLSSNNVRFKFEYTSNGNSNNFYIDNLNVPDEYYYTGSANHTSEQNTFSLYPNPSNGMFIIQFQNNSATPTQIQIFDIAGKEVYSEQKVFETGLQQHRIVSPLAPGLYTVRLITYDTQFNKKMIVNGATHRITNF
jgi:PKD repeat protein